MSEAQIDMRLNALLEKIPAGGKDMIPEEKAELAALLQERMRKRERWPKMKLLPETNFINGITVISAQIALPSPATVEERPAT